VVVTIIMNIIHLTIMKTFHNNLTNSFVSPVHFTIMKTCYNYLIIPHSFHQPKHMDMKRQLDICLFIIVFSWFGWIQLDKNMKIIQLKPIWIQPTYIQFNLNFNEKTTTLNPNKRIFNSIKEFEFKSNSIEVALCRFIQY
jgi:hypothetical protein